MAKSQKQIWLSILLVCIFNAIVLFGMLWFFPGWDMPQPNPPTAATPVTDLEQRVNFLEKDIPSQMREIGWKLDQKLYYFGSIALVISVVAAFFGFKTYNDIEKTVRERVDAAVTKALFQLDPTNLEIWLITRNGAVKIKGEKQGETIDFSIQPEMEGVENRLKLTGLLNVRRREKPDKACYRGVTIVPIFNAEMEKEFASFLNRNKKNLESDRAAFIMYTMSHRVKPDTLNLYENLVTANMPPTVASMVLTVGRGLKLEPPSKE